jgi:hypothetical protein
MSEQLADMELDDVTASLTGDTKWDNEVGRYQFLPIGNGTYQVLGVRRCAICGRWKTTRHSSHE